MTRRDAEAAGWALERALPAHLHPEMLGLCFCRAWVSVFMAFSAMASLAAGGLSASYNAILFCAVGACVALAIAAASRHADMPQTGSRVFALVVALTTVACSLMLVGMLAHAPFAVGAGSGLGGAALALMRLSFGGRFVFYSTRDAGIYNAASFFIAACIAMLIGDASAIVLGTFSLVLPLLVAICLWWNMRRVEEGFPATPEVGLTRDVPTTGGRHGVSAMLVRLCLGMCVFVFAASAMRMFYANRDASSSVMLLHHVSDLIIALVLLLYYAASRDVDLLRMYRVVLPLLVIGYSLVPFLPGGSAIPAVLVMVGQGIFDVVSWVVLVELVHTGHGPSSMVFGAGVGATLLGNTLGRLLGVQIIERGILGQVDHAAIALVMACVLVTVVLLALPEGTLRGLAPHAAGDTHKRGADHVASGLDSRRIVETPTEVDPATTSEAADVARPYGDAMDQACAELAEKHGLTARETDVLGFLARGRTISIIARDLTIAESTAQTHAKHIYLKLGVHRQQELIDRVQTLADTIPSSVGDPV